MSHESELEEQLTKRFGWWWRGVFVGLTERIENQGSIASLLAHSQEPKGGPAAAGYDARLGALFALLNRRRERSAFLYELQQRFSGRYEFGKPWLPLEEEQKRLGLKIEDVGQTRVDNGYHLCSCVFRQIVFRVI